MILKTIRLHPFAGISDKEIKLVPGLNVVLGPNEAGKSTVFNAILCAFFTSTKLTSAALKKLMRPFIPVDGDTAAVELEFQVKDSTFKLRKSWGPSKLGELTLPGGTILTDDHAITSKIQELLPATEGTFRSTLASYQSGLSQTIADLQHDGEATRQIGDILRGMVLNSDGISIDGFKARLGELYRDYLGRWDLTGNQPEQGRGIEDRWIKGAGKIVLSFYAMEEARAALDEAKSFEERYDQLNREIATVTESLFENQNFVERNAKIVKDAQERRTVMAEIRAIEATIGELKKINTDWPVFLNKIQEMDPLLQESHRKAETLRNEKLSVERAEQSKSLRETVERARRLKLAADDADRQLQGTKKLTKDELECIRQASHRVDQLQSAIKAGKLAARIESKGALILSVQKDLEPAEQISLNPLEAKTFEAGGKIQLVHSDWKMEITSGEIKVDELISDYKNAQQSLDSLLEKSSVANLNEAIDVSEEYATSQQTLASALVSLRDALGGESLEQLEARLAAFGDVSPGRSLAVVVQELTEAEMKVRDKKRDLVHYKDQVQSFEKKYSSHEDLMMQVADQAAAQRDLKGKVDKLRPLPADVTDVDEFILRFEQAEAEVEVIRTRKNDLEITRATLEGGAPEQSVEELGTLFDAARNEFQVYLRKGEGMVKLQEATETLLGQMDTGTFGTFQKELSDLLATLSGNKYLAIQANDAIPTGLIRPDGTSIPPDLLSTGTKDILGLALRLSMAKHFLGEAEGFVMMDDPLVDLDPDRQARAVQVLEAFASNKQTIIFTCHPIHAQQLAGHVCRLD